MAEALVIVDHGSRAPEAHAHLEWVADQVRSRAPGLRVFIAHMELAPPSLSEALEQCARAGLREVAVHPLFLVPGRHLQSDIPRLVEEARARHPDLCVSLLPALGSRGGLADLVLETLRETDASNTRH